MTDQITDPQAEFLTAFARGVASRPGSYSDDIVDSARALLATVDAPEPTLAEELRGWESIFRNEGRSVDANSMRTLAARAEQIEQERDHYFREVENVRNWKEGLLNERDEARAEVERLTAERVTEPSPTLNDPSMTRHATVAREENVSHDLPEPADVKPGEAWIVNIDGVEIVPGFKASVGWICYRLFVGTTKAIGDERITLVSRLVPAPRIITTPDELERLAATSIIRDGRGWPGGITDQGVTMINGFCVSDEEVLGHGPVMVLWEPGE